MIVGDEKMDMIAIAGMAVTGAALAMLLKQYKKEYALLLGICVGVMIFAYVIFKALPAINYMHDLMKSSGVNNEYAKIVIKSLGVCYLAQLAADSCRDAGETAMASKVELAGKISVVLFSLPMLQNLAKLALGMIKGN